MSSSYFSISKAHHGERFPLTVLLLVVLQISLGAGLAQAERWDRYNGWEITSFELTGLPDNIPKGIKSQLALHGQRKLLGMKRPPFKTKLLAEDLARIRLLLAQNGFPRAVTHPVAEANHEARQLALRIDVDPGSPTLVGKLEVSGWPARVAFPDTTGDGVIHENMLFQDETIQKATVALRSRLVDFGFEAATVVPRLGRVGEGKVAVHFLVESGPYSMIDSVVVQGCSPDLVRVALRVMDLKPSLEFSEQRLKRAALDLRGTQLFGHVELETENLEPGHLLLKTKVEDARMRTWQAGVGTWSDNPWLIRLAWTHNNLFKHGVGFRIPGVFGEYEKSLGANIFWLGWLTPRSRTSFGFTMEDQVENAYHSREERVDLVQAFRPNLRDIWKVGVSVSLVKVETFQPDPEEAPDAQGPMLEFWSDWKWDRTDDPLRPARGHYLKVSATAAPPNGFTESPYSQVQLDGAKFQSLSKKVVLAGRMRVGGSWLWGSSQDLLPNRRFYAGGYNTMRGYNRRYLGPLDLAGEPRGGQYVVLGGLELRFPLLWLFDGAAFFDSGQVWRVAGDVNLGDLSGSVGLALDLATPLGPLRLNYAANVLNRLPGEPHSVWLLGIGYPW